LDRHIGWLFALRIRPAMVPAWRAFLIS
jgi:hypothetical protein